MPACLVLLALLLQDLPTFRSDIALVRVDVEVRSANGTVDDLERDSFHITDDGRSQKTVYFAHESQPLDIVLLFDTSASMRPVVTRVAEAAHTALGELRETDRVAVMAFADRTTLITDLGGDLGAAEKGIGEVLTGQFRGSTLIHAALADAARYFAEKPRATRRRAIIIITDDEGASEQPSALRELWNADAIVLGVIVRKAGHLGPVHSKNYVYMGMRNIAIKTGGDSLDTSDAGQGIHEMIHRLRLRYSLYYALPQGGPGQERKVQVQLTRGAAAQHPGAVVYSRTGYISPNENR